MIRKDCKYFDKTLKVFIFIFSILILVCLFVNMFRFNIRLDCDFPIIPNLLHFFKHLKKYSVSKFSATNQKMYL